ncbi:MAG: HAMP domain-containing histidine kinase [Elusimicrobia bacterium]|nr:HAMP domain-containing histidine kinase [Elusimicrobiota bacterium]
MSIRIKLALVLMAGIAMAALTSGFVFVELQRGTLRAAEEETVRRLLEDVSRIGEEAQLAKDPLMLLDFLALLARSRPEVHHSRVLLGGQWQEVPAQGSTRPASGFDVRSLAFSSPDRDLRKEIQVEVLLRSDVLKEHERRVFQAMLRDLGLALGVVMMIGIVLSLFLGWTLTRRVLLIQEVLKNIGEGKLGSRVGARGSDEIARLARGVDAMSERLREVEELKKTFIASVTHELRSPLGAIESYVKAILGGPANWPQEHRRDLERIRDNAGRLGHFVSNLLEMAKIERGKLDFYPRQTDPKKVVEDTVLFFAARAQEAKVRLESQIDPGLPVLRMDPDLIAQVLNNFISNALKFTRPAGLIRVTARFVTEKEKPYMECAVEDSGIGIPKEALGRIFTPFERVKNPIRATGAGLGLAISKSIIELHQGIIGAQSEPGRGSRFYFLIPALPASDRASKVSR